MEDLLYTKKDDKLHLIVGKEGDRARGRGRSPVRGGSARAIRHRERKKGKGGQEINKQITKRLKNKILLELRGRSGPLCVDLSKEGKTRLWYTIYPVRRQLTKKRSQPS